MPLPKIFQQKLFKCPTFIVLHIAAVAGIFTVLYPEVELSSLSVVIMSLGLLWALTSSFLIKQWRKWKEKKKNQNQGDTNDENDDNR